jgi:hypothetical protein
LSIEASIEAEAAAHVASRAEWVSKAREARAAADELRTRLEKYHDGGHSWTSAKWLMA